jgi:hypothetical protein
MFMTVGLSLGQEIQLKNEFFYLDGRKFFIKGIGYDIGAIPGQVPWQRIFDAEQLHFDMKRIQSGGYNTIRTWGAFSKEELEVLRLYDLKIIMGIWIDPHGNFADPAFIAEAKGLVQNVLNYSSEFDNIIAYLIMNEPLPETISAAGYPATKALWVQLKEMIHNQHPSRPVSFSNTCNGTYIGNDIFDFSAYNVYIYNPVTVNFLHGYKHYIQYLRTLAKSGHPLVISEYGLSVSPSGPGAWGYGGNTLMEQKEGLLHMYHGLVNGGASGSCVFNYSDGWWKSGDETVHNDTAEEWFGLVEYHAVDDSYGTTRPVWDAIRDYQSAIITEPKDGEIYPLKIPVEMFLNDTIHLVEIRIDDQLVFQKALLASYLLDSLQLDYSQASSIDLQFNCYDMEGDLVKTETRQILVTPESIALPRIDIQVQNPDFWDSGFIEVSYKITQSPDFLPGAQLRYIYYPHVGFNYGNAYETTLSGHQTESFSKIHYFSDQVDVLTLGASFDVSYNAFTNRIYTQRTFSKINDLSLELDSPLDQQAGICLYPNPVMDQFCVVADEAYMFSHFDYIVFNLSGQEIQKGNDCRFGETIPISFKGKGVYLLKLNPAGLLSEITLKMVRN